MVQVALPEHVNFFRRRRNMKKSLKRIVSASLATMLMVGALTGCGGGDKKAEAPKKAPAAATDKIKLRPAPCMQ